MSKSTYIVIFGVIYSAAVFSTVSGQNFSAAWTASWPSSDQSKPTTFLPAWKADFASIDFSGNGTAPIVPVAQVGKANAAYCDWSYNLCNATTDVFQCSAPLQWGLTFDDGPVAPQSSTLYDFLAANNQTATHFMIGSNIVQNPDLVLKAFKLGSQIAVHTWTHRPMTTLASQDAYAELRWCRDIIKNITGVTPVWWRPPYGDVDNRIRTIATHLGLTTTTWNRDTNDWCIDDPTSAADGCGAFQADSVHTNLELWATQLKTSPYGVVALEHELSPGAVSQFMTSYPIMKANGWLIQPVASCNNRPFYLESTNTTTTTSASVSIISTTSAAASVASNDSAVTAATTSSVPTANASSAGSLVSSFTIGALSMVAVIVVSALQL